MEQVERIAHMEDILDRAEEALSALRDALERYAVLSPELEELEQYYTGGSWQQDYRDDEAGKLPTGLKRGILSEDGIWNLLLERDELVRLMEETTAREEKK